MKYTKAELFALQSIEDYMDSVFPGFAYQTANLAFCKKHYLSYRSSMLIVKTGLVRPIRMWLGDDGFYECEVEMTLRWRWIMRAYKRKKIRAVLGKLFRQLRYKKFEPIEKTYSHVIVETP